MSAIANLDWEEVRKHYDLRCSTHKQLLQLMKQGKRSEFVDLLLGISDPNGNYSAVEHGLGPYILGENANAVNRVWDLARLFRSVKTAHEVPKLIRQAGLEYLQIGVGSEASCMLNPRVCRVANARTIWTHLVIKHTDDFEKADMELRLYRDDDSTSEMAYAIWTELHSELATSMTWTAKEGEQLAREAGVAAGSLTYLWADCIADALYAGYYGYWALPPHTRRDPLGRLCMWTVPAQTQSQWRIQHNRRRLGGAVTAIGAIVALIEGRRAQGEIKRTIIANDKDLIVYAAYALDDPARWAADRSI